MKKIILSTLLGLGIVSGAFAAGSYTENFESYNNGATSGFTNGAGLARSGSGDVYAHSSNWKALRLIQDGTTNTTSTFNISGVEKSGQRINAFSVNFGLHFKNSDGLFGTNVNIADRFMVEFGGTGSGFGGLPYNNESGSWGAPFRGNNLLSIVWDFYDNDTGNGSGDSNTNDRIGIEIYKNGALLANSFVAMQSSWVQTSLTTGAFDNVSITWFEDTDALDMSIGGISIYSGFDLGGFTTTLSDNKFAFSASSGAETMDVFVDDISITTVPEPSAGALLMVGIGGLMALRRARRSRE